MKRVPLYFAKELGVTGSQVKQSEAQFLEVLVKGVSSSPNSDSHCKRSIHSIEADIVRVNNGPKWATMFRSFEMKRWKTEMKWEKFSSLQLCPVKRDREPAVWLISRLPSRSKLLVGLRTALGVFMALLKEVLANHITYLTKRCCLFSSRPDKIPWNMAYPVGLRWSQDRRTI